MATNDSFAQFIWEQLTGVDGITHRKMMGEYIVYLHGRIAAYLCDDRLLVKPVPSAVSRLPDAVYEPPYEGAKAMIRVDAVDDRAFLKELFEAMFDELPVPKKKRTVTA